jgi:hypothetical protein
LALTVSKKLGKYVEHEGLLHCLQKSVGREGTVAIFKCAAQGHETWGNTESVRKCNAVRNDDAVRNANTVRWEYEKQQGRSILKAVNVWVRCDEKIMQWGENMVETWQKLQSRRVPDYKQKKQTFQVKLKWVQCFKHERAWRLSGVAWDFLIFEKLIHRQTAHKWFANLSNWVLIEFVEAAQCLRKGKCKTTLYVCQIL